MGIAFGLCCMPLGVIFAVLSLTEARRHGRSAALAYIAFGVCAAVLALEIMLWESGTLRFSGNR